MMKLMAFLNLVSGLAVLLAQTDLADKQYRYLVEHALDRPKCRFDLGTQFLCALVDQNYQVGFLPERAVLAPNAG